MDAPESLNWKESRGRNRQCQVLVLPLLALCDHRQVLLLPRGFLFYKWEKLQPALSRPRAVVSDDIMYRLTL